MQLECQSQAFQVSHLPAFSAMARDGAQREAGRPGEGAAAPVSCFPAGRCSAAGSAGAEGAEGVVGGCSVTVAKALLSLL